MITKRCSFDVVFNSNSNRYADVTARQLARGFAAYGIHIMNEVDADPTWQADQAYEIAIKEYASALGCLITHTEICSAPEGFAEVWKMAHWIECGIQKYYLR